MRSPEQPNHLDYCEICAFKMLQNQLMIRFGGGLPPQPLFSSSVDLTRPDNRFIGVRLPQIGMLEVEQIKYTRQVLLIRREQLNLIIYNSIGLV